VKPGYVWVIGEVIAGRFIQASAQVAQPGLIEASREDRPETW
jgi:hypothetical protein